MRLGVCVRLHLAKPLSVIKTTAELANGHTWSGTLVRDVWNTADYCSIGLEVQ